MFWSPGWHRVGSHHPAPRGIIPSPYCSAPPGSISRALHCPVPQGGTTTVPTVPTSERHHPTLQCPIPPNNIIPVPVIARPKAASSQLPTVPSPRVTSPQFPLFCTPRGCRTSPWLPAALHSRWHHPGSSSSCPPRVASPQSPVPRVASPQLLTILSLRVASPRFSSSHKPTGHH